jgi:hypothetical protein
VRFCAFCATGAIIAHSKNKWLKFQVACKMRLGSFYNNNLRLFCGTVA